MSYEAKTPTVDSSRSESQSQGGRTPYTDGKNDASKTSHDHGVTAHDLVDYVSDKAHHAGDALKETGENIACKARGAHASVTNFTKEYPTAAVLIALGAGVVIARMLPHR